MCLFIAGLVLLLDHTSGLLVRPELMLLDERFLLRGPRGPGPDVVLVTIDEKSLTELAAQGIGWPWPRSLHGEIVDVLTRRGAALVVFDIFFSERQDRREDRAFAAAVARAGNVLLATQLPPQGQTGHGENAGQEAVQLSLDRVRSADAMPRLAPPARTPHPRWMAPESPDALWSLPLPELVAAARGVGFVDMPPDPDAIFRRAVLLRPVDNGCYYPHLALAAAAERLGVPPREIGPRGERAVALGSRRVIPLSEDGTVLIDFVGPSPADGSAALYPRYSYSEVLRLSPRSRGIGKEMEVGTISADAFRDKVVFIGATAPGLYDVRPSPYSAVNVGVETNANLTDAILQERFFTRPGAWFPALLVMGIGLACGRLLGVLPMRRGTLAMLLGGLLYSLVALALFGRERLILPMAAPLVTLGLCYSAAMAYRFQSEFRERLRNRAYLDLYVTRQVAERILSDPSAAELGGQRVDVSVLFSDIRGFTPMSEAMSPEAVVAILNEYFDRMVPVIMVEEGTLDKYVGDAIMAVWGAPMPQRDHARRAVRAGLGMLAALSELQAGWRERGVPAFEIGIGINSGEAVAGNIGSRKRAQYTVIGDSVNTAARLESLNKELGTRMIISDATYRLVEDMVEVRLLPPVMVKGKAEPLTVYEVLALKESVSAPVAGADLAPRAEGFAR